MKKYTFFSAIASAGLLISPATYAQDTVTSDPEFDQILSMDISDLTITSVSKRKQKLNDAASAIYVITQEDLLRMGTGSIPEALRMVPGLNVARSASNKWAISSRGFNNVTANKLLVLIDGRTIYSPVLSGTYWDDQRVPVQDIDRIEVIRGPGASIWGANAVNGVINIITKHAKDTQDNLVSFIGTTTGGLAEAHHGGKINEDTYYRIYGQYQDISPSRKAGGGTNTDDWNRIQTGFRIDGKTGKGDEILFKGDIYGGSHDTVNTVASLTAPFRQTVLSEDQSYGGNILGRWTREVNKDSHVSAQAYIDHYTRNEYADNQHVTTADLEVQHNLRLNDRNNFTWGAGGRLIHEDLQGSYILRFQNSSSHHEIFNIFAQNEYALVPKKVFLTLGSKVEYNDYTGIELEPSARASWHLTDTQMVWGAVSRAVRIPTAYEDDFDALAQVVGTTPLTELRLTGNTNQKSEELIVYEIGHRIQATQNLQFDTTAFFNDYKNLQTIGSPGNPFLAPNGNLIVPYPFTNQGEAQSFGAEISFNWNVTPDWRLTGSYSFLKMELDKPSGTLSVEAEDLAPQNQFSLRSYYNVSDTVHWDNMLYFVDNIRAPAKAYTRYDTRVAWLFTPGIEASIIGRNLFQPAHSEFPATPQATIGSTLIGQLRFNF